MGSTGASDDAAAALLGLRARQVTRREVALAVLLRQVQWKADEAAFDVVGGRLSCEDCRELSCGLRELAVVLDDYAASVQRSRS
ncbi:hypothetical protein FHU35_121146 [Saccharopolyspora dendranthemae]|uniref:Uncharacterized protein n=1 Tax=Saccharopolyspora dendranthemae TaxID=1181886 RepID=A0A561U9V8_9PSEU|nr:hypothetical protein FHU35_121146 [Saccharopolyspora dendranthemae]